MSQFSVTFFTELEDDTKCNGCDFLLCDGDEESYCGLTTEGDEAVEVIKNEGEVSPRPTWCKLTKVEKEEQS
jgi:hypothetical protein